MVFSLKLTNGYWTRNLTWKNYFRTKMLKLWSRLSWHMRPDSDLNTWSNKIAFDFDCWFSKDLQGYSALVSMNAEISDFTLIWKGMSISRDLIGYILFSVEFKKNSNVQICKPDHEILMSLIESGSRGSPYKKMMFTGLVLIRPNHRGNS